MNCAAHANLGQLVECANTQYRDINDCSYVTSAAKVTFQERLSVVLFCNQVVQRDNTDENGVGHPTVIAEPVNVTSPADVVPPR